MVDAKEWIVKDLLGSLDDEVEFFFSNFFGTPYPSIYRKELSWKPATDVYETESDYVVVMELAQIKTEEISITFQEGVLLIRGVRKAVPPPEPRRYHKMEINYGPFERRIAIPSEIDLEGLSAKYSNGFLEIRLPKRKVSGLDSVNIEVT